LFGEKKVHFWGKTFGEQMAWFIIINLGKRNVIKHFFENQM
jgi:hypothetical protein